jgi:hypothetical protein
MSGVTALLALLNHILGAKKSPFTIIVPHHSINLIAALQKQNFNQSTGYLGMLKILNPAKFLEKLQAASHLVGVQKAQFTQDGDGFLLQSAAGKIRAKNIQELGRLTLGPTHESEVRQPAWQELQKLFPLALWLWGWDSI